jgi:Flp pilus assembly protein TadD
MRFADGLRRCGLLAALCAVVSGCASVATPSPAPQPAQSSQQPAPSGQQPAASGQQGAASGQQLPAQAPSGAGARAQETPSGISPTVQRKFDAALDAMNAGHPDEAAKAFQALTQSNADLGGPHANLGIIYRQEGKQAEAVAELEQAVRLNPQQPVFLNQLGISYRLQGQFAKARDAYEKAIALDPNYPAAYLNLGILFDLYFWDSKRALELYDRYLALTPGGDDKVVKWVADIKNRSQQGGKLSRQEQP